MEAVHTKLITDAVMAERGVLDGVKDRKRWFGELFRKEQIAHELLEAVKERRAAARTRDPEREQERTR